MGQVGRAQDISSDFIEPGRPIQNGFIECLNDIYRRGKLDMHILRAPGEVRERTAQWQAHYYKQLIP
ncbi:hypothetical protein C1H21_12120 [Xanthomonas arboricola pv. juglandis]|nr:hypothetical protein C1H21_12120 [Xanthomonas arboricola pv. juglandis]